jgi:GST-like protein
VNRLYGVLNNRLRSGATSPATNTRSPMADLVTRGTVGWEHQGQSIDEFRLLQRWFQELGARPGVQRRHGAGADLNVDVGKLSPGGSRAFA